MHTEYKSWKYKGKKKLHRILYFRCMRWITNIRRKDLVDKKPEELKHMVVCAAHFEKQMFKNPNDMYVN